MKYFLQTACAATLIGLSSNVYAAAVNGINYDPAHTDAWNKAQQKNDLSDLTSLFNKDLAQIKAMGFNTIKTYFSAFCVKSGPPNCINPAQAAKNNGLKVLVGVFEFRAGCDAKHCDGCMDEANCKKWTKTQVDAAIALAKDPDTAGTVIGIVVGNEDMFNDNGNPIPKIQKRIVDDINAIRKGCDPSGNNCQAVSLPVTTAQRQGDWCGGLPAPGCDPDRKHSLNQDDPEGVLNTIQIIGANIYPYWAGSPEALPPPSVASQTQSTATDLLTKLQRTHPNITSVIITEEGWPSCAGNWKGQFPTSIDEEISYFSTWSKHENQTFDSYYFMAYDTSPTCSNGGGGGPGSANDADKHFGLCLASGATKDSHLISCP